jgi:hypothetical protein
MSDRERSALPGEPQTIMGSSLVCAPGGSRTTWERAATSQNATFAMVDGAWPCRQDAHDHCDSARPASRSPDALLRSRGTARRSGAEGAAATRSCLPVDVACLGTWKPALSSRTSATTPLTSRPRPSDSPRRTRWISE